ncbi:MAG: winged helix-turn-helix transcriptional regulator [Parcubacteria group bacterium]|nr:winged helix-turn-helix transcriptional regulator [Parcubacteria group bacterium]
MMQALENIFSSKTRTKMLALFLTNPEREYFVRELTRKLGEEINSVRRELENLSSFGLLKVRSNGQKKYYSVRQEFELFPELRALFLKSGTNPEERLKSDFERLGDVRLAVLSGKFTRSHHVPVDLFLVGAVDRARLKQLVTQLENELGEEINYTVMDLAEFRYRAEVQDQFLARLLSKDRVIVIDRLTSTSSAAVTPKPSSEGVTREEASRQKEFVTTG